MNRELISVYTDRTIKAKAEKLAIREGRTLSNYVQQLIIKAIENESKAKR